MLKRQTWDSAFEGLEPRLLLAGNVLATLSRGALTITGDAANNEIQITQAGALITITGLNGTTVNGLAADSRGPVTKKISVTGNAGNDTVIVNGINLAGNLSITGGKGNDTVVVLGSTVAGKVTLNGGKGTDALTVLASPFGKLKHSAFENFDFFAPVITSSATPNVAENTPNTTPVQTLTATDADVSAQANTWSITGGADWDKFNIQGNQLFFNTAPDFEAPTDAGANNVYNVQVTANDGMSGLTAKDVAVTVTNVNEPPVVANNQWFPVDPGAANDSPVGTVIATDPEGAALTYTIISGDPNGTFGIEDPSSGLISVIHNNTIANHSLTVRVSDGVTLPQDVMVWLVVNVPPVFTTPAPSGHHVSVNVAENTTAVITVHATDANVPAQTVTYSLVGGEDMDFFTIDANTGDLSFITPPDYEDKLDWNGNGTYHVHVMADDGYGGTTVVDIRAVVTPVNDNDPYITSDQLVNVDEGTTAVVTLTADDDDEDQPGQAFTYSITGGPDAAKFTITGGNNLRFITAPDFETPTDVNANNVYLVQVTVNDGGGRTGTQTVWVTVVEGDG